MEYNILTLVTIFLTLLTLETVFSIIDFFTIL